MALRIEPPTGTGLTVMTAFLDALESDLATDAQRQRGFLDWALKVPEPRGPLNFQRWPFQKELYEQGFDDREVVVMKATQLGISAWLVRWALAWADTAGARVVYVFPRARQLADFSIARVRPLLDGPYLRTRVPAREVQNVFLRSVGRGIIYFRGSHPASTLESIDADCLCLDEHDLLVQQNIPVAERRVGGQDSLGLIRRVGFPTVTGYGIHKQFLKSDQRRWHVRCEHCGERQPLTWAENVDLDRAIYVCRRCHKELPSVAEGEWVATYPDRDVRGYHITKLLLPTERALPDLIEASKDQTIYRRQVFHNRDLGEPWEEGGARLTPAMIAACQRDYFQLEAFHGKNPVLMGVDVASTRALNVWISEQLSETQGRTLHVGLADSFDELARLMDRFAVHMATIDHLPEGRLARAFAERFAGRVYIVNYAGEAQKDVLAVDDEQRRVSVRRTEAIDAAVERIRAQHELLPQDLPRDFVGQMCANVRSLEQNDVGRVKVLYRNDGPDDYMQALTFCIVASECWWIRQQVGHEEITSIDEMTDLGFRRSALNDPDSDYYSPGRDDSTYGIYQGSNGHDSYGMDSDDY